MNMVISVFQKAFQDSLRTILWTGIGFGIYALFIISFFPAFMDQGDAMMELLESYPPEMMALFGVSDISTYDLTDPANYVEMQLVLWLTLILGAMVVVQGFNAITNAERDGSLDMTLSLPITRRAFLIGRFLSTLAMILVVLLLCWIALGITTLIWEEFEPSLSGLAIGLLSAFPMLAVIAGFVYLLAALIPSSKRFVGGLAYLFVFGSYLLFNLSAAVESLNGLKPFLLFNYYDFSEVVNDGFVLGDWVILTIVSLLLIGAAWFFIDRKELSV